MDVTPASEVVCPATTLMGDMHWGTIGHRCALPAGHEGDHRKPMTACKPLAFLTWSAQSDENG